MPMHDDPRRRPGDGPVWLVQTKNPSVDVGDIKSAAPGQGAAKCRPRTSSQGRSAAAAPPGSHRRVAYVKAVEQQPVCHGLLKLSRKQCPAQRQKPVTAMATVTLFAHERPPLLA